MCKRMQCRYCVGIIRGKRVCVRIVYEYLLVCLTFPNRYITLLKLFVMKFV